MTHKKPYVSGGILARIVRSRATRNDATAQPKRKNFSLDQHRIDLVKAALGAKTETEAITGAMDVALEMAAFGSEVQAGSAKLLGKGGFVNRFDDVASLDFSGFTSASLPVVQGAGTRGPRARGAARGTQPS